MAVIGFDISKNGTGVCVRPQEGKVLLYTYTKHLPKKCLRFVHENDDFIVIAEQIQIPEGCDDFGELRHISSHIFENIFTHFDGCDNSFYAENYSMGGNGRITMLAEMTALIKDSIYRLGHRIDGLFAPSSIKKEIGGHGRLEKQEIYENCWGNPKLKKVMTEIEAKGHKWKSSCWQSDVLDAFAVAEMGIRKREVKE